MDDDIGFEEVTSRKNKKKPKEKEVLRAKQFHQKAKNGKQATPTDMLNSISEVSISITNCDLSVPAEASSSVKSIEEDDYHEDRQQVIKAKDMELDCCGSIEIVGDALVKATEEIKLSAAAKTVEMCTIDKFCQRCREIGIATENLRGWTLIR